MVSPVNDSEFETEVLKSEKPVLIDFWAEWCAPCKMISPVLEEISKEMGNQIDIRKLNIDENREVPTQYGIRGIPTLMIFINGQLASTKVGASSKAQLEAWIKQVIQ